MMRGNIPTWDMVAVQDHWLRKAGLALFGSLFVRRYRYQELFFLREALAVRRAVSLPLVLIGGVRSLAGMARAMAEGFDFVAMGRALIRDPAFVRKLQQGELAESDCDQCNRCVAEMDRGGVRCTTLHQSLSTTGPIPATSRHQQL